jgi:hypothetical protein
MAFNARFIPKFPEKYAGDVTKVFARSSWELHVMKFLDNSRAVVKWGSEELRIPYLKPYIDQMGKASFKPANYYPDFIVVYRDQKGGLQKEILEVKPLKESVAEKANGPRDKLALAVNIAKWKAAEEFAQRNGLKFRVLTEKSLFVQKPKAPKKPRKVSK